MRRPTPFLLLGLVAALPLVGGGELHPTSEEDALVPVEVKGVVAHPLRNSLMVVLESEKEGRALVIEIGPFEADAIQRGLRGEPAPRPLTHDLFHMVLDRVKVKVKQVIVAELRGETFYAWLDLEQKEGALRIDSRPSDAIALAVRFHSPILVRKALLEENGIDLRGQSPPKGVPTRRLPPRPGVPLFPVVSHILDG